MQYLIVNKETLKIEKIYEWTAEIVVNEDLSETIVNPKCWILRLSEPLCVHLPLPEGLVVDCVKAIATEEEVIVDEIPTMVTTYSIVEDADKVAAKALSLKNAAIAVFMAQCEVDLDAKMFEKIGTKDRDVANAVVSTLKDMLVAPAAYINALLTSENAVTIYANAQIILARDYAVYRIQRVAERDAAIAAL